MKKSDCKQIRFLTLMVTFSWVVGCSLGNDENRADLENQLGTVEQFGIHIDQFVIRPDADTTIAYFPVNALPESMREAGLRVIFSGNLRPFPIDPPYDPSYPLLELTEIKQLDKEER